MANGICEFGPSRGLGEVCVAAASGPNMELAVAPGGTVDVGDGRTSLSRDGGSLRSVFQMPVPQGKADAPGARPIVDEVEWDPQGPAPVSPDGVLGCEAVGDMEPLAKEPFRGRLKDNVVSFSQEERRAGL